MLCELATSWRNKRFTLRRAPKRTMTWRVPGDTRQPHSLKIGHCMPVGSGRCRVGGSRCETCWCERFLMGHERAWAVERVSRSIIRSATRCRCAKGTLQRLAVHYLKVHMAFLGEPRLTVRWILYRGACQLPGSRHRAILPQDVALVAQAAACGPALRQSAW